MWTWNVDVWYVCIWHLFNYNGSSCSMLKLYYFFLFQKFCVHTAAIGSCPVFIHIGLVYIWNAIIIGFAAKLPFNDHLTSLGHCSSNLVKEDAIHFIDILLLFHGHTMNSLCCCDDDAQFQPRNENSFGFISFCFVRFD